MNDTGGNTLCIYGDPAYPLRPQLQVPFPTVNITDDQQAFNAEARSHDTGGNTLCIYGDPAYPLRPQLQVPFPTVNITDDQQAFNAAMSKGLHYCGNGLLRDCQFFQVEFCSSCSSFKYLILLLFLPLNFAPCHKKMKADKAFSSQIKLL